MYRFGLLLPFEDAAFYIEEVSKKTDVVLIHKKESLRMAIEVAKQLQNNDNVDAILCRNKTGIIITPHLNIPVIQIDVAEIDILKAAVKASYYGSREAYFHIAEDRLMFDLKSVEKLSGVHIEPILINSDDRIQILINAMKERNCHVALASNYKMVAEFRAQGINCVMIQPGVAEFNRMLRVAIDAVGN